LAEEKLSPELAEVFAYLKKRACVWVTVRDVREALRITNGAARYRLTELWRRGYINRYRPYMLTRWDPVRRRWVIVYRIFFHYIPPPGLYKIKIRIYNEEYRKPTPTGMFQGWFDIDARLDPATGLVDWDYHLTKTEVNICRYHFIGYWKGMSKWRKPGELSLSFFMDERIKEKGIPYAELTPTYQRPYETYAPGIPTTFIEKALKLTMKDLIIGESSVTPKPIIDPDKELGIWFQKVMIIDSAGVIRWHEERSRWIWRPSKELITKVKEELRYAT